MNFRTCFQRVVLTIGVTLPATVTLVAESPKLITPGRWEVTLRNELPESTEPVVFYTCVEPGSGETPQVPKDKASDPCRVVKGDLVGNELSYTTKCGNRRSSELKMSYHGNSYEGVLEVTEGKVKVRQIISAKRVGSCDDPAPDQTEK